MRLSLYCSLSVYVFPFISTVLCELQTLTRTKTAPPPPWFKSTNRNRLDMSHLQRHEDHVVATNRKASSPTVFDFNSHVWRRKTHSTSTLLSTSHRSEALRLGQRAINLLKCHFQREMDCRDGIGKGREADGQVRGKISEDKSPA